MSDTGGLDDPHELKIDLPTARLEQADAIPE
jgi:hypothetical protein